MKVMIRQMQGAAVALSIAVGWGIAPAPAAQGPSTIDNNEPFRNPAGHAATFSTQGVVDLTGEYFQAQGVNGRSCVTCHIPQEAWSVTPGTIQRLFDQTGGTHPIFNRLDANHSEANLSTVEAREAAYSMLLSRGVFRRGGAPRRRAARVGSRCRRGSTWLRRSDSARALAPRDADHQLRSG